MLHNQPGIEIRGCNTGPPEAPAKLREGTLATVSGCIGLSLGQQVRLMLVNERLDEFVERRPSSTRSSLCRVKFMRWSVTRACGKL